MVAVIVCIVVTIINILNLHHYYYILRGGSRGRVQGMCTHLPETFFLRLSNTTGILQTTKKGVLLVLK